MPIPAHYRKLVAWQRADALFIRLHLLALNELPTHERFVLASQMRRAALSVPANIVEGTARIHGREQLQFLRIAWSSLLEAGYYIHVAETPRIHFSGVAIRDRLRHSASRSSASWAD
jgi:four helix bundle protein